MADALEDMRARTRSRRNLGHDLYTERVIFVCTAAQAKWLSTTAGAHETVSSVCRRLIDEAMHEADEG